MRLPLVRIQTWPGVAATIYILRRSNLYGKPVNRVAITLALYYWNEHRGFVPGSIALTTSIVP